jgi:hypothetical protein
MEYRKNPNYGRTRCFRYLLSPAWQEAAIFIGINRLAAKGLEVENDGKNNNNSVQYPCSVVTDLNVVMRRIMYHHQ